MKVDTKIVPIEVEEKGWFSTKKKKMHQLQYTIQLTDVEKAIIEQAGLREYTYFAMPHSTPEGTFTEILEYPIRTWIDYPEGQGTFNFDSLIEAQAYAQEMKDKLVELKELMTKHTQIGTEDSFEL